MSNKLTFDVIRFLKEYNIPYVTEHNHCTKNRVNIHCPFCHGSRNYHLGIHRTNAYGNCWRCGGHSAISIVQKLLALSWSETYSILEDYANVRNVLLTKKSKQKQFTLKEPVGLRKLIQPHVNYIQSRGFNVDEIQRLWKIQSTGSVGDLKHRIYIPIHYLDEPVSYQCRSTIKDTELRYISCREENEKVHYKHIVYGIDYIAGEVIVVVEGPTDVWRLGPGAVATFGTSYTQEQMYLLSRYNKVFILFDKEKQAQKRARKLAHEIAHLNKKGVAHVVKVNDFNCDPGDLPQNEARQLMLEIQKYKGACSE